ncbi:MAG: putative Ig domain-containing protein [Comamonas sp.]|uniref:putative Ig domain-containing protein n=1 Tax=Comamonas sp. TaxID=34028 RepID=UPI002FC876A4
MTAEDGDGATVTDTFNLVVANTNDAPTLANVIAAQNATEDAAFSCQSNANTFADVDAGDTLSYSAKLTGNALPAWLSFDAATRTFSGTPVTADIGTLSIDVTAEDGNGVTVTDTFSLVVTRPVPPVTPTDPVPVPVDGVPVTSPRRRRHDHHHHSGGHSLAPRRSELAQQRSGRHSAGQEQGRARHPAGQRACGPGAAGPGPARSSDGQCRAGRTGPAHRALGRRRSSARSSWPRWTTRYL